MIAAFTGAAARSLNSRHFESDSSTARRHQRAAPCCLQK
jgi:hypothetical protein